MKCFIERLQKVEIFYSKNRWKWSILMKHFIKHIPMISEECNVTTSVNSYIKYRILDHHNIKSVTRQTLCPVWYWTKLLFIPPLCAYQLLIYYVFVQLSSICIRIFTLSKKKVLYKKLSEEGQKIRNPCLFFRNWWGKIKNFFFSIFLLWIFLFVK